MLHGFGFLSLIVHFQVSSFGVGFLSGVFSFVVPDLLCTVFVHFVSVPGSPYAKELSFEICM